MHPAVAAAGGAQVTGLRHSLIRGCPGRAGWRGRPIRPQRARVSAPGTVPECVASTDIDIRTFLSMASRDIITTRINQDE